MGRSTGLVFAHFSDKEALWRAAMGTPPPVDSALTRAAPRLLEVLEALVDRDASAASDPLLIEARQAIEAAHGANPGAEARTLSPAQGFPARRLKGFEAHVTAELETRRGLPRLRNIMDPVFNLCALLVAYRDRTGSQADVYAAAVSACATITQVGVHGAADVPFRTPPEPHNDLTPETADPTPLAANG